MDKEHAKLIVEGLCDKALETREPTDAMKFSQAAVNVANAYCSLAAIGRM